MATLASPKYLSGEQFQRLNRLLANYIWGAAIRAVLVLAFLGCAALVVTADSTLIVFLAIGIGAATLPCQVWVHHVKRRLRYRISKPFSFSTALPWRRGRRTIVVIDWAAITWKDGTANWKQITRLEHRPAPNGGVKLMVVIRDTDGSQRFKTFTVPDARNFDARRLGRMVKDYAGPDTWLIGVRNGA
ncbi:hypothetical protein [Stackebrandtia nassauensis]|uniref:Uncharacterized protein n=1 Tax=Stackebrandtia nassauensis (strain DSM 44728 / CIP 108903 / NRRL B-16338 / NBRC 102104 / LLR-40K-21) TaxID=446470 RepID=D3Q2Q8_STANL|nr:hypothetical protein [Stackebrandtia nassauensis]ADD45809.1 hypothetical protein Snas_6186 [Stackebrandtia nassauensis DSM 44728]